MSLGETAHIGSIQDLVDFKRDITSFGNTLQDISDQVDRYFTHLLESFRTTISFLEGKLQEAQARLDEANEKLYRAQQAYENCTRRQRWVKDEDGHSYLSPSCALEAGRVDHYSSIVRQREGVRDEWKRKVTEAQRIYSQCEAEIDKYNCMGGMLVPPGGRGFITYMATTLPEKSVSGLDLVLDKAKDILSLPMSIMSERSSAPTTVFEIPTPSSVEEDEDSVDLESQEANDATNQIDDIYGQTTTPNLFELCPECGKPLIICRGKHKKI